MTRTDFVRRVTLQLNDLVRKGKVEKIGRGRAMKWKLARYLAGHGVPW